MPETTKRPEVVRQQMGVYEMQVLKGDRWVMEHQWPSAESEQELIDSYRYLAALEWPGLETRLVWVEQRYEKVTTVVDRTEAA